MTTTIAQRINELVAEHGSLVKAARHLDMGTSYLSRLRSGIKDAPSDETLARLGLVKHVTYTRADTEHPGPRAKRDKALGFSGALRRDQTQFSQHRCSQFGKACIAPGRALGQARIGQQHRYATLGALMNMVGPQLGFHNHG